MKWRDAYGKDLHEGDIVEEIDKRLIGKVVISCGLPAILVFKRFSPSALGYEPIELYRGPMEAHIKPLVARHTKLWWKMNGYRLGNVELLKKAGDTCPEEVF